MNMNDDIAEMAEPSSKNINENGSKNIVKTPEGFYTIPSKTISFDERKKNKIPEKGKKICFGRRAENGANIELIAYENLKYKLIEGLHYSEEQMCLCDNIWRASFDKSNPRYMATCLSALGFYFQKFNVVKPFLYYVVSANHKKGIFDKNDILPMNEDGEKPPYRGFYDINSAIQFAKESFGPNFFVSPSLKTIVDGLRPNTQNPKGPVQYPIGHSSKNRIIFCDHCEKMATELVKFEAQKAEWRQKYEEQKMRTLEAEAQIESLTKKLENLQTHNDKLTSRIVSFKLKTQDVAPPEYGPEPKPTTAMTAYELAQAWMQQNQENSTPEILKDQKLESSPSQTAGGKDLSSPLMADALPKSISSENSEPNQDCSYPEVCKNQNQELSPSLLVDGENILNPVMADNLPKIMNPVQTGITPDMDEEEIIKQLEMELKPSFADKVATKQGGKQGAMVALKHGEIKFQIHKLRQQMEKKKGGPNALIEDKEY